MSNKKITMILILIILLTLLVRFIAINRYQVSLGLNSIYLEVVKIFDKLEDSTLPSIFNKNVDISIPLNGSLEKIERKYLDSYFNILKGNLVLHKLDYEIFPRNYTKTNHNPLSFERVYNSKYSFIKSPLGYGWRPIWFVDLFLINDIYVFRSPLGDIVTFKFDSNKNKYICLKNLLLEHRFNFKDENKTYQVIFKNELVYEFSLKDNLFRLTSIIYNNIKYKIEYNYDKRISAIVEISSKRKTEFNYNNTTGVIESVVFPSKLKFLYEYDENLNLKKVTNSYNNYHKVYSYNNNRNLHLLTAMGNQNIQQVFEYENNKIIGINWNENDKIKINRSPMFGICELILPKESRYTLINYGDLRINIKGPLDYKVELLYSKFGQLIKIVDSQDRISTFTYDKFMRLIQRQFFNKGIETYQYDDNHNLISVINPLGYQTRYQYNDNNQVIRKIKPNGDTFKFRYSSKLLESIYVENSNSRIQFWYDKSGNLKGFQNENGQEYLFKYNKDGYLIRKISPSLTKEKYKWNAALIKEVAFEGIEGDFNKFKSFEYDNVGNIIEQKDINNQRIEFIYDELGRVIQKVLPNQQKESFKWNIYDQIIYYKNSKENVEKIFVYDSLNRLLEIKENSQVVLKLFYDKSTGININPFSKTFSSLIDNQDNKTNLLYNNNYLIKSIKRPDGNIENFEYDINNNLVLNKDKKHKHYSYYYDKNNFIKYIYDKKNQKVDLLNHDWRGNISQITFNSDTTLMIDYNKMGYPISISYPYKLPDIKWLWDEESNMSLYSLKNDYFKFYYNNSNNLIASKNNKTGINEYIYDNKRLLKNQIDNEGRIIEFTHNPDNLLNTKSYVNNKNKLFKWNYNLENLPNKVSSSFPYTITWDKKGNIIKLGYDKKNIVLIAYDSNNNVIKKTYPGLIIQLNQYKNNKLESVSNNGINHIYYEFDENNKLKQLKYPNNINTEYTYDENNRVTSLISINDNEKVIYKRYYEYDNKGRVTGINTERGLIERFYNNKGLVSEEVFNDENKITSSYTYNKYNHIDTYIISSKDSKEEIKYIYNPKNFQLLKKEYIKDIVVEDKKYHFNLFGNILEKINYFECNKIVIQLSDNLLKIKNLELKKGENIFKIKYFGINNNEKKYDLKFNFSPKNKETRKYDLSGKLIFRSMKGSNYSYFYNDEGLLEKAVIPFGYDIKTVKYDYYGNKMLAAIDIFETKKGVLKDSYKYIFDENEQIVAKISNTGKSLNSLYFYSPEGKLLYRIDSNKNKYFYHSDINNSIIGITDINGKSLCSYYYDFTGQMLYKRELIENPFLFKGHFFDKYSGFYICKNFVGLPEDHSKHCLNTSKVEQYSANVSIKNIIPSGYDLSQCLTTYSKPEHLIDFLYKHKNDSLINNNTYMKNFDELIKNKFINFFTRYPQPYNPYDFIKKFINFDENIFIPSNIDLINPYLMLTKRSNFYNRENFLKLTKEPYEYKINN